MGETVPLLVLAALCAAGVILLGVVGGDAGPLTICTAIYLTGAQIVWVLEKK